MCKHLTRHFDPMPKEDGHKEDNEGRNDIGRGEAFTKTQFSFNFVNKIRFFQK